MNRLRDVDIQVGSGYTDVYYFLSDGTTDQPHAAFVYGSPPRRDYFLPPKATQVASTFHLPVGHPTPS
jgi:hypothetical protein